MPLRYLLDEHLRGPLSRAIRRNNLTSGFIIDVVRVGDAPAPPLSSGDSELLAWAEQDQRILVTADKKSMPLHLAEHLGQGRHSPGVFMIVGRASVQAVLSFLVLAAYASEPEEWQDRIHYIG